MFETNEKFFWHCIMINGVFVADFPFDGFELLPSILDKEHVLDFILTTGYLQLSF